MSATTNNQLSSTGFSYDTSGNMLTDGANTYGYNAESEIKSAAGVNYTYDGDGNRVEKSSGKIYWYGAGAEILDESDTSGNISNEYVFFGGKRIAMRNVSSGTIYYYEDDMLGSARTMVQAGQTSPCYDGDFYPFGGERIITNTCTQNYKFEGKERDTETGNDDFGARYYSSRLGRWLSADWSAVPAPVPYANLSNPQTLNLYAMVSDNPETFADLDGHCGTGGLPGAPSSIQPCNNPGDNSHADAGDGYGNSGIAAAECSVASCEEVSSQSTQIAAQEAAQAQNQKTQQNQQLTYKTVSGGPNSQPWVTQWKLSKNSEKGGWIVQEITDTDASGKQTKHFWEAWQVPAKSQYTIYFPDRKDDTQSGLPKGMKVNAEARFYEGLQLPSSFKPNNPATPSGILRSTTLRPNLPTKTATAPVNRAWVVP